jgi:hypothetical protein
MTNPTTGTYVNIPNILNQHITSSMQDLNSQKHELLDKLREVYYEQMLLQALADISAVLEEDTK